MASRAVEALRNKLLGPRCPDCGKVPTVSRMDQDFYGCSQSARLCNVVCFNIMGEVVQWYSAPHVLRREQSKKKRKKAGGV